MLDPHVLFERLEEQISELASVGEATSNEISVEARASVHRACIMLSLSALDAFMHEKAAQVYSAIVSSRGPDAALSGYLGVQVLRLQKADYESIVRYHLSFKTMVLPAAIDKAIEASGVVAADVWREIGIARGSRESRLRNMLDLQVDRRNQIAHEGDWDPASLDFRGITEMHFTECLNCIKETVAGIDKHWTV